MVGGGFDGYEKNIITVQRSFMKMIHWKIFFRQQFVPMMLKLKAQLQLMKLRCIMIVLWLITM